MPDNALLQLPARGFSRYHKRNKPAIRHIPIKNMGQKYIFYGFNVVKKYSICKYDTTSLNTLFRFLQPNTCPPIPNIQLMHLQDNNHPALSKLL